MQKRLLQDVVRKEVRKERSQQNKIVDVPEPTVVSEAPRRARSNPERVSIPSRPSQPRREPPPPLFRGAPARHEPPQSRLYVLGGLAVLALLGLGFIFSFLFSGASITVHPKQQNNVFIDGRFIAKPDPLVGELGYTEMTIERTASRTVAGADEVEVEEFATGEIEIQNAYSTESYPLIKRTRFEAPDGRIYRIRDAVTVPGATRTSGDELVPGTVVATVYADQPGESFNLDEATFTIPGFEGMPQFTAFSAEAVTPIEGGFAGIRASVSEEQEEEIRNELQQELIDELRNAANSSSEKPENFHLFADALLFDFESSATEPDGDGGAVITERGTVRALLFEKGEFARHLAANTIAGYDDEEVKIENLTELTLLAEPMETETLDWDGSSYTLRISGTADFTWQFDPEALKQDLAGRDSEALSTILSGHPGIDKAEAILRPFWNNTFPENPEEITLTTVLD